MLGQPIQQVLVTFKFLKDDQKLSRRLFIVFTDGTEIRFSIVMHMKRVLYTAHGIKSM